MFRKILVTAAMLAAFGHAYAAVDVNTANEDALRGIKGIGPVMAERMVNHFGVDIMHVIDEAPGRLIEVDGLGPKRTERITKAWAEQKAIKEVMIFLQGVGVSTSLAVKIYKKYGDESIQTVEQNPYRLASDVWGIGFKTADTIAASVGIARDSPERIKAGRNARRFDD